ncbi:uncharacterized protein [Epargyreus clarus]|uniref:uncharacterized protein n=1 Tax=Epargyreus clarus TaxID=520877 RepID=UPI003C2EF165
MPKIPYKAEKCQENDEDYEIVSFEDFCDKSPGAKTDLLTLNDNINYRLYYENDKGSKLAETFGESSREADQTETSLNGTKNGSSKRKISFTPFGRGQKNARSSMFSGVIPKPRGEGESSREHRYERFSPRRGWLSRVWEQSANLFPGMLAAALLCALGIAAWWAVGGALGGGWGDDHYRRLWERAHPEEVKKPLSPISTDKNVMPEYRYHDHNNLSTKNKSNATETTRKKDLNKKNMYTERPPEVLKEVCSQMADNARFDCYPQFGANEDGCIKRGCCWQKSTTEGAPYCFYPPQYDTYHFVNMTENKHGMSVYYEKGRNAGYPGEFQMAKVDFNYLSDNMLQIKITDAEHQRFESPYPVIPVFGPISNLKYRVQMESSAIGFKVIRNSDNVTIFNTQDVGGLVLSDKFLQLSGILPTPHLYGLGEKRARFMMDINWKTYTLFNQDMPPTENYNGYGTHPFYLALETTGKSHGLLLLNSNAMDVVLQPTPAITYRTIGGILNMFVFLGPTPTEVIQQYTELVGRPFMPPYWSLGFHLCKYNYGSLNATREVWKRTRDAGIPFDVQWNDLDYMHAANDFSYDEVKFAGLPAFVRQLHDVGMHYVILIDPGQSPGDKPGEFPPYDRGMELDIFIKNSTNQPFVGKVWNPVATVWPDFTHPKSTAYWVEMMSNFHKKVKYDGAWIDMNEISNFISGSKYGSCAPEELPYKPLALHREGLKYKTLCMDAQHYAGTHYDWHNLYALTEAIATQFALHEVRGRRAFVISRASFPGLGRAAGHWSGDVASDWHDMRMSIPELLSFSLFGIPMMGADICGFNGNTTVELCKRWMQLGAFYPFSRNHNSDSSIPQDPVALGRDVTAASREALRLRYRLLPHLYTLFWRAHVRGDTVARPLFFEFPDNALTRDIDDQFLLGSHVMVSPLLQPGATTTRALFPAAAWYSARDGGYLAADNWRDVGELETVAVRSGAIIPQQEPPPSGPVTTANSRSCPMQLMVVPDKNGNATGELYWDDGDSINSYEEKKYSHIEFKVQDNELRSVVQWWGHGIPSVNGISILGQAYPIKSVTINGNSCNVPCIVSYITKTQLLTISGLNLSLDKPFNVKWTYQKMVIKTGKKIMSSMFVYGCKSKNCTEYDCYFYSQFLSSLRFQEILEDAAVVNQTSLSCLLIGSCHSFIVRLAMTERCQTKFAEKTDNQNYIIFIGILVALLGVLYFYRFHFVTICVSYVLGCVACYYGLNSNIFHNYVEYWTCHFVRKSSDEEVQDASVKGCITCGSRECNRHDPETVPEPWTGLQIHKQLDQAIEDFYNTILDQFINTWYSKITLQPFFVDELRHQLRYASASLLRRAIKIDYARFITDKLAPCALRHCAASAAGAPAALHVAATSRAAELKYLRCLTEALLPYVLRSAETQNSVFRVLIREIFAGWVLLSLTDVLADPYILNALIILATGDETMAPLPASPNYNVEFLETFVRQNDSVYSERARLLRVDLELLVNEQDHFYAFMQHMKTTSHIHLLQFYKDIKLFQTRILNPELTLAEQRWLHREACELCARYIACDTPCVPLPPALVQELRELLESAADDVTRLQTSRALYQAARQSHVALEKIMMPKFLHSEEYYKLLIGPRIPVGYNKQMTKRPQDRLLNTTLKLGSKLKGALKPQTIDGQVLDCFTNSEELPEGDGIENMDILKYLDSITAEETLGEQDLSTYKVVLTHVETRLAAPPRRGAVRVFRLAVHRAGGAGGGGAALWAAERSEHDFHLLRAKLHEFHGDRLLHDLPLPSRRDNSPLETLRYKYEDFLQRLLQKSLLQTSELLYLFLTVDGDFSMVVQASTLNATGTDLGNIYQSVAHKLRKEKGQHLESFMKNYLISTDKERYQALKHGTAREVEEALEVSEEHTAAEQFLPARETNGRNILNTVFQNNFDVDVVPAAMVRDTTHQTALVGFAQCFLYLLVKLVKARGVVSGVLGGALAAARALADAAARRLLARALHAALPQRRLAHLVRLGHAVIFGKKASTPRMDPLLQREQARKQLLNSIPPSATIIVGPGLPTAVLTAFEVVQCPQLNKQLVYNLLDLCVLELFPELRDTDSSKIS